MESISYLNLVLILTITFAGTKGQNLPSSTPKIDLQTSPNTQDPQQEPAAVSGDPKIENQGYARSQVFEYSFQTSHDSNPTMSSLESGKEASESAPSIEPNPSTIFQEHDKARESLPRFFSYDSNVNNEKDNYNTEDSSVENANESRNVPGYAPKMTFPRFNLASTEQSFVEKMVPEASYSFKYSPPKAPPMPSFMGKMSFNFDDDDDEFGASSKKVSAQVKTNSPVETSPAPEKVSKVQMVKQVMGTENQSGKPWGSRTTMVYRDPKSPNNYMQVTEVKMTMKNKKDDPQKNQDQVSRVATSSRSNYKMSNQNQPALRSINDDFFDEGSEPEEPVF